MKTEDQHTGFEKYLIFYRSSPDGIEVIRISPADRILLWPYLARVWAGWREHIFFGKPDTIIAWKRKRFRDHWRSLSQARRPRRPPVSKEIYELIRRLPRANPT